MRIHSSQILIICSSQENCYLKDEQGLGKMLMMLVPIALAALKFMFASTHELLSRAKAYLNKAKHLSEYIQYRPSYFPPSYLHR